VCPNHFFCLVSIVRIMDLSSPIVFNYPAHFFHFSLSPHFKSLNFFYILFPQGPCFSIIQYHTPYQCLYYSYLQCSFYFSSHMFSHLLECFFSYHYSSLNFSVAFGICLNHTSWVAEFLYLFNFFSTDVNSDYSIFSFTDL